MSGQKKVLTSYETSPDGSHIQSLKVTVNEVEQTYELETSLKSFGISLFLDKSSGYIVISEIKDIER